MAFRSAGDITEIIIHCSDSGFGDAAEIDRWHKERGWSQIGYHRVILNGVRNSRDSYDADIDGVVEAGRPISIQGAHCRLHNKHSIGICLIGRHHFTAKQLTVALPDLIDRLRGEYPGIKSIKGHTEYDHGKSCPNFDVPEYLRKLGIQL